MPPEPHPLPSDRIVIEIRTTFPSPEDAERCGTRLLDRQLAACIQIDGPLASRYRWKGSVEAAEEYAFRAKTTAEAAEACEAEIVASHPYTTPEILTTACRASAAYAAWVRESVGDGGSGPS